MKKIRPESRLRIKANAPAIVKRAMGLALALALAIHSLSGCARTQVGPNGETTELLPEIEVHTSTVSIDHRTRSGAVYLMTVTAGDIPAPGRIVLLKKEQSRIMAFRVLRLYPEKKQFAGRKVRVYDAHPELDPGQTYMALQKLGDVGEYAAQSDDMAELSELEAATGVKAGPSKELPPKELPPEEIDQIFGEILDYDPELDAESSPPPRGAVDSTTDKGVTEEFTSGGPVETEKEEAPISVEEITPLEPHPFSLSGEFGYMRNGDGSAFPAGGGRFSFRLKRMVFLSKPLLQDEFSGEVGVFLYKAILTESDVFTVIPIVPTFRYTIHLNEDLSVFGYAGFVLNAVMPAEGYNPDLLATMQSVLPAVGLGVLFRIGPSWEARVDLGYDIVGMGLVIGF